MSTKRTERILGPYKNRSGFRVIQIDSAGKREAVVFETEAKAERYIEILKADLNRDEHTTGTAFEAYTTHLKDKGNEDSSTEVTA